MVGCLGPESQETMKCGGLCVSYLPPCMLVMTPAEFGHPLGEPCLSWTIRAGIEP